MEENKEVSFISISVECLGAFALVALAIDADGHLKNWVSQHLANGSMNINSFSYTESLRTNSLIF